MRGEGPGQRVLPDAAGLHLSRSTFTPPCPKIPIPPPSLPRSAHRTTPCPAAGGPSLLGNEDQEWAAAPLRGEELQVAARGAPRALNVAVLEGGSARGCELTAL